jgi:hypothetical protein
VCLDFRRATTETSQSAAGYQKRNETRKAAATKPTFLFNYASAQLLQKKKARKGGGKNK